MSSDTVVGATQTDRKPRLWRNAYVLALGLLFVVGVLLVALGAAVFEDRGLCWTIFTGVGVSVGPAAIVGVLFRVFLLRELRRELVCPILEAVGSEVSIEQLSTAAACAKAGMVSLYSDRASALTEFLKYIPRKKGQIKGEIMVVGSSLKGLLQREEEEYAQFRDAIFEAVGEGQTVKFLLTHPAVADLRASQEGRGDREIGAEIIATLRILARKNVRPEHVKLYKGTPTCFAIKTSSMMMLNPYPYRDVAFSAPCLLVKSLPGNRGYFYDEFAKAHFGAWDTTAAEPLTDFEEDIRRLEGQLGTYAACAKALLGDGAPPATAGAAQQPHPAGGSGSAATP